MVHQERRLVNGHVVEIKGNDHQIYVDGEVVTDEVLAQLGGVKEDGHGLRMAYANGDVFSTVKHMIRAEQLSVLGENT